MTLCFFAFILFEMHLCLSFLWPSACDAWFKFSAQLQELRVSCNHGNNFSKHEFYIHTRTQDLWVNLAGFLFKWTHSAGSGSCLPPVQGTDGDWKEVAVLGVDSKALLLWEQASFWAYIKLRSQGKELQYHLNFNIIQVKITKPESSHLNTSWNNYFIFRETL